jgi:hypothetical protein
MKVEYDKNGKPYVVHFQDLNKISMLPDEFQFLFKDPRNPTRIIKEAIPNVVVLYEIVNVFDADFFSRKRPGVYVVYQIIPEQHLFLRQDEHTHETTIKWEDIDWNGFKVLFK